MYVSSLESNECKWTNQSSSETNWVQMCLNPSVYFTSAALIQVWFRMVSFLTTAPLNSVSVCVGLHTHVCESVADLNRFTVSAHVGDDCVFSSGRGLIHCDLDQVGWRCVFVISAECLWMIGVSDTACFSLGRSSQIGQTGGTEVCGNEPQLWSVRHYSHPYTVCFNKPGIISLLIFAMNHVMKMAWTPHDGSFRVAWSLWNMMNFHLIPYKYAYSLCSH